ncbi:spore maturation protein [Anoxybacter fermentans]|uniref:Spore maturation protein n=1 Tax=Anoxybacter fermentans TaxID=1323375 RepID=A0A3S9SWH6_9FIRM|nr:nucleoside recognition domain-containing protein [Anoxybacter fermentans]AZR72618.1 spore maturation protein [Anoxybacter fermentans]
MINLIQTISAWAIPVIVVLIPCYGFIKGVKVYDTFVEGAKDGFKTVVNIIPYLVAMMVTINILRASGTLELLIYGVEPILKYFNIPKEIFPLVILRPLSGSGSMAFVNSIFQTHGPDSLLGKMASTIIGSSETTFYVVAVYFGAVGIKDSRYAIPIGLIADVAGFLAGVFICNLVFKSY